MRRRTGLVVGRSVVAAAALLLMAGAGSAQPPGGGQGQRGGGGMGMRGDPAHEADMQVFHALLDAGGKIRRTVTLRPDGVDTLTESDDPAVTKYIQTHVDAMAARVSEARPIHRRDPLFRAVFAHAAQISMRHDPTPKGVRVIETSTDPYVVKLIQAHADVVTLFVRNGRAEAMKNHEVPAREP